MIPIVLTGTIIPNTIKTAYRDSEKRRKEYLDAIKYYKKFSKVYFMENSSYDLLNDAEFLADERFAPFKFDASKRLERGKGFLEFQMIEELVKHRLKEDCFVYIDGRYIYKNFDEMFSFVVRKTDQYNLIIDTFVRTQIADTGLFFCKKCAFLKWLQGSYLEMDDAVDVSYAEHVIYNRLKHIPSYTFFPKTPILHAIRGSTGKKIAMSADSTKVRIRNVERMLLLTLRVKKLIV